MSETDPTPSEIRYLASLAAVRTDGVDKTAPALARRLLEIEAAAVNLLACYGRQTNPELGPSQLWSGLETNKAYDRLRLALRLEAKP